MIMDGHFYYKDKKFFYLISDDNTPIKKVKDEYKIKRYITFFDDSKQIIDSIGVYGSEEVLCNISTQYVLEKFIEIVENK